MKKNFLITFIFLITINLSCSSVEEEAKKLIQLIKDKGKTQDVGVYIAKFGTEKAIQECVNKNLGPESVCRRVVEIGKEALDRKSNDLINEIKGKGKWDDVINYIKKYGKDKATQNCADKKYAEKAVCRMVVEIATGGGSSSSPFKRETKSDHSIILTPKSGKYSNVLIFLHGYNGSPEDFVSKFNKENGIVPSTFKIILPCGPYKGSSGGYSWFGVTIKKGNPIDLNTINSSEFEKSSNKIKSLIRTEAKKVDYKKIFVAGFSQGACLTYDIGLSFEQLIGGIGVFCASPYTKRSTNSANKQKLKVFVYLGKKDYYFPLTTSKKAIETFLSGNNNLTIKVHNALHEIITDGYNDFKKFISSITK